MSPTTSARLLQSVKEERSYQPRLMVMSGITQEHSALTHVLGPVLLHPRVLRDVADILAQPVSISFPRL